MYNKLDDFEGWHIYCFCPICGGRARIIFSLTIESKHFQQIFFVEEASKKEKNYMDLPYHRDLAARD